MSRTVFNRTIGRGSTIQPGMEVRPTGYRIEVERATVVERWEKKPNHACDLTSNCRTDNPEQCPIWVVEHDGVTSKWADCKIEPI